MMLYKEIKVEKDFEEELIYIRRNGENVSDPDIIANCRLEQNRDIIENARLGSYDKYGNYIFMPEIRFELINIPKFIYHISKLGNKKIFDLKTIIPIFGELFFKLTISENDVVLYLVETVSRESGGYMEVYEEVVDAIALGKMNNIATEDIFSMYHIYENDTDEDKKTFFIYDYINLLTRKIYLTLLSKELNEEMQYDEHEIFNTMIAVLKDGGEYGGKVLSEFMVRLKDRPEIFEMENTEKYNKAVNEVLLSALDIATTQTDKENPKTKEVYLKIINARNKNVDKYIEIAHKNVEKDYVQDVAKRAVIDFNEEEAKRENVLTYDKDDTFELDNKEKNNEKLRNKEVVKEFYEKLIKKQKPIEKHIANKAVLKQGKEKDSKLVNSIGGLVGAKLAADKLATSTAKDALNIVKGDGKFLFTDNSATAKKQTKVKTEEKSETKSSEKSVQKSSAKSGGKSSSSSKKEGKSSGKKGASSSSKPKSPSKAKSGSKPKVESNAKSGSNSNAASKPNPKAKTSPKTPVKPEVNKKQTSPVENLKKQEEKKKPNNAFSYFQKFGNEIKMSDDFEHTPSSAGLKNETHSSGKAVAQNDNSIKQSVTSEKSSALTSKVATEKTTSVEKATKKDTPVEKTTTIIVEKPNEKIEPTPKTEQSVFSKILEKQKLEESSKADIEINFSNIGIEAEKKQEFIKKAPVIQQPQDIIFDMKIRPKQNHEVENVKYSQKSTTNNILVKEDKEIEKDQEETLHQ